MKVNEINIKYLYFPLFFLLIMQLLTNINSSLKCEPDFKSIGDNYSSVNDPQDNFEYFYGYEFAHRAGGEYYDHWKGIYWDNEPFCYDAYDNFTRPEKLSDLTPYEITDINVVTNLEDAEGKDSHVLIEHDQTNLINFHSKVCMTKQHTITKYNHGEYELLIKMDKYFEEKFLDSPHHFIFTIENPSNEKVTFSFKSRNFIYTIEEISTIIKDWGVDPSQCVKTEEEEADKDDDAISSENEENTEEKDEDIKPPCEKEKIVIKEELLTWFEKYPIPEVFYFTKKYTIEPHKSRIINISMTFEKNTNENVGGYFIKTSDRGKSNEPFYWPDTYSNNGKLKKLTNLEIILESDLPLGISSFSLMRRKNLEES